MPESHFLQVYVIVFFGLMLGSFATALSWRSARGESWVSGRSRCPSCNTILGLFDLVPLVSWIAFRGRCRHCKAAIGVRYPIIEACVLAACLAAYGAWGFTLETFIIMAAVPFLVASAVVDIEQMVLPDSLQVIIAWLGVVLVVAKAFGTASVSGDAPIVIIFSHLCAGMGFAGAVWVAGRFVSFLKKKEALGFGDIKFYAIAGLWLGGVWLPAFMVFSGIFGLVSGLGWRLKRPDRRFPFGPALISAFYACLLLQGMGVEPLFGL